MLGTQSINSEIWKTVRIWRKPASAVRMRMDYESENDDLFKLKNSLASSIDSIDPKEAAYDAAAKEVFCHREIISRIIKDVVSEAASMSIEEISSNIENGFIDNDLDKPEKILGLNTEFFSSEYGRITQDLVTILSLNKEFGPKYIMLNIEFQNQSNPGYPLLKRAYNSAARMIESQKNRFYSGDHYEGIQPVYSIWICTNPEKINRNTMPKFAPAKTDLIGYMFYPEEEYNLINIVIINIGSPEDFNYRNSIRMSGILLSGELEPEEKKSLLEKDFGIRMSTELEREVNNMCSLGAGIRNEAKAEGFAQGKAVGLFQGKSEGLSQGRNEGLSQGRNEGLSQGINQGKLMTYVQLAEQFSRDGNLTFEEVLRESFRLSPEEQKEVIEFRNEFYSSKNTR